MSVAYTTMASPLGELLLTAADGHLTGLYLPAQVQGPPARAVRDDGAFATMRCQLEEYFAGERREFELPVAPPGTPFQQRVWAELPRIGYGETISYAELASRVGRPTAIRAAGAANGANPVSIVIPCHRVIGSNGSLTGYGGGLEAKRTLLELERAPA
ncbi:MAG: methylated-DNA-[protein]-cysteine S-methyltransferase [Gaiellales bacterium]|jgi:methylated-DNA-[protein]-cysteine S-methyltransferase|nr:methylated-DNA-[protein]-cysteine S-methyltransferase [Gaiellales bacterium]